MKKFIVKYYFDKEVRILGFLIALFSWVIGVAFESWWIFILSVVIGSLLFDTHYEIILNRNKKYYKRSIYLLGIRLGKRVYFQAIDNCNIVKGKYTDLYMLGPFGISTEGEMYHAFIKFSDGQLVQIGKSKNRVTLIKKINFFRFDYLVDIIDSEDESLQSGELNTKLVKSFPQNKMGKDLTITGIVTLIFGLASLINDLTNNLVSYFSIFLILLSLVAITIGVIKIRKAKKTLAKQRTYFG
ncbi:MAG: hypothetical protein KAK04_10060 [Cyclobacteriaceae bacterium]|nr:hypothetical protein [Cyclobacteriaceae bacterium]